MDDALFTSDAKLIPYWWDTVPRPSFEAQPMPAVADVAVIGSGYTGLQRGPADGPRWSAHGGLRRGGCRLRLQHPQRRPDFDEHQAILCDPCPATRGGAGVRHRARGPAIARLAWRVRPFGRHGLRLRGGRAVSRRPQCGSVRGADTGHCQSAEGPRGRGACRAPRGAALGTRHRRLPWRRGLPAARLHPACPLPSRAVAARDRRAERRSLPGVR